jgi:hypothetical protein
MTTRNSSSCWIHVKYYWTVSSPEFIILAVQKCDPFWSPTSRVKKRIVEVKTVVDTAIVPRFHHPCRCQRSRNNKTQRRKKEQGEQIKCLFTRLMPYQRTAIFGAIPDQRSDGEKRWVSTGHLSELAQLPTAAVHNSPETDVKKKNSYRPPFCLW